MSTADILIKIAPILLSIALGYALAHSGMLKPDMFDVFKKIVVNVTLPAGLLSAYIKIRFKAEYIIIILSLFVTCVMLFFIGKFIAKLFSVKSKYFPFLMTAFEAGMMGYALFTAVYGTDAAADFGIVDIGQVTFVFLLFVPMLIRMDSGKKGLHSVAASLKMAARLPVIWAILTGLICSLSGLWSFEGTPLFRAAESFLTFVSAPTAFLICLVIGSGLKFSLKGMKLEILTAVLKVALAFSFAFILKYAVFLPLGMDRRIITALFVMCSLPAPFVIPVFMKDPGRDEAGYVSNTLSIGSVLGVLSFSAVIISGL
jgi:predicted permease